jgi:hypothetical protein
MTFRRPILTALLLLLLTACSDKAASTAGYKAPDNAPAASSSPPPPIHFDQTAVLTLDGVAQLEQAYGSLVDACKKAGVPMHALTPSEVAKLGRRHLEAWIGPDKQARHEESWDISDSPTCHFSLTHEDQTWIADANGRVTTIDNVTHQVDVEQGEKPPWTGGPLSESDAELDAAHGQAGWSKIGVTNSNGTQCVIWQSASGEQVCAWSGGRQWGYSADGASALRDGVSVGASIAGSSIMLWAHPGKGPSWRMETQAFSVGQPLDPRAFVVPANANTGAPR